MDSRTCFLPMITRQSHQMLRLHRHYTEGFLPQAGGVLDQSAKYVEAMEVIDGEFARIRTEREERARQK